MRELTDKVSDMLSDIFVGFEGENDGLKLCGCGEKCGMKFFFVAIKGACLVADACESGTSFLHVLQLCHNVGKDGVASFGGDVGDERPLVGRIIAEVSVMYEQGEEFVLAAYDVAVVSEGGDGHFGRLLGEH